MIEEFKGQRVVECVECGKRVEVKSKTFADKYCEKCKKEKELERKRRYYDNKNLKN